MDRRWLYGGLAVVAGVGLARLVHRGAKIVPGETRLLLIGGAFAQGLAPPLGAMARDQKVAFDVVLPPNANGQALRTEQWALRPELPAKVASFRPTLVAVALDVAASDAAGKAKQAAALKALLPVVTGPGVEVVWIGPPTATAGGNGRREPSQRYFPTATAVTLPRGPDGVQPTVAGYAGWAGALWQWLS
jgi:hypothetical protein